MREVSDVPLCLDTTNIEAMEAGLRACKGGALINSTSLKPGRLESLGAPLAAEYDAGLIGLTLGAEGVPRDANERGFLAASLIARAVEYGIDEQDIWIDPIVLPVNTQQLQNQGCTEFVAMMPELSPQGKSTCGLSNVSSGVPVRLRGILNRTYLVILKRYGMYSVIANAFDTEVQAIAGGGRPQLETLVHKVMDGEHVETSSLSEEERDYVKTANILLGKSLYSDSWLDL